MATLYELTGEYLQLIDMMDDPVDEQTLLDTLEAVGGELEEKAEGYACVMRNLDGEIAAIKGEIDRLTKRRRAIENNITRMKQSLQLAMETTGKTKFRTNLFSFSVQNNPVSVVIDADSTEHMPEEFIIIQAPTWNKAAIKDALQAGKELTGIAHLEQTRSLRIR